ncbi:mechanosensitive ion channel [Acidobacteria bacterium ACD]|nr:MAG: mechanosensitive ion channel family protein [Acidobacteriota bacterium]MDL1949094.1 mechanosensitive ion channel [Acidobacteria bacterium ACD]
MRDLGGPLARIALLSVLALSSGALRGEGTAPLAPGTASEVVREGRPAAVTLANREVVVLRARTYAASPAERAAVAATRLAELVDAGIEGPVVLQPDPLGLIVKVGGRPAFALVAPDTDPASGETLDALGRKTAERLATALREAGELRHAPGAVLKRALFALLVTGVFLAVLAALRRLGAWVERAIGAAAETRAGTSRLLGFQVFGVHVVRWLTHWIVRLALWLVGASAAYLWATGVLRVFPYTRPWGEQLGGFLLDAAGTVLLAVLGAIPGLAFVAVIFLLARVATSGVRFFFDAVTSRRLEVPESLVDVAVPTRRIAIGLVWLFALIMAYPYLPGSQSEAFKGITVLVGVMVSLGSSALFGQMASGLSIMYSRTMRPGDLVRSADFEGVVKSIGLVTTRLQRLPGEEVVVPNTLALAAVVRNRSRAARTAGPLLQTSVTIGYDAPWRQVYDLLLGAAERTEGIRKSPAPWVLQTSLSDFYVEYELSVHLEDAEAFATVRSSLHERIQDAFNEQGVQIMSPHYFSDPAAPKVVPKEHWQRIPPAR